MIVDAFKKAFEVKEARNWECIAVAVDLHGTVFVPTYSTEEKYEYYPGAKECLNLLTYMDDVVKMYLYTCSTDVEKYIDKLDEDDIGVYYPEIVHTIMGIENNEFQNFDNKPYFNVLLDDKAGFNPDRDWTLITEYLKGKEC